MLAALVLVIARQGHVIRSSKSQSEGLGLFTAQIVFRNMFGIIQKLVCDPILLMDLFKDYAYQGFWWRLVRAVVQVLLALLHRERLPVV